MARTLLAAAGLALVVTACGGGEGTTESPYIVQHRAWRAGERDSQIAVVKQYGALGFASALVDSLFPQDWITEVVPNPAYPGNASLTAISPRMQVPTDPGMIITGLDLYTVDTTSPPQQPSDTVQWLMVFWYQSTEPTFKGFTVVFSRTATIAPTTLNTTAFDAAGGLSGGGGGEVRPSSLEEWTATAGKMSITTNTARTAAGSAITSGPFVGGVQRSGLFGGKLQNVDMTRILPTAGQIRNFDVDFSRAASFIPAVRIECKLNNPVSTCRDPATAPLFRLLRRGADGGSP